MILLGFKLAQMAYPLRMVEYIELELYIILDKMPNA